ncbi:adhesion G protein-coupled receptor E3-like isoform X2 [Pyxicephalus adspersus]|uniref:adhesion G protein-coupled receptor E3-like isoform X2 n=1 Tax=Pyxicephalus adspersus TaxID=30357 RepID=UPI003B5C00FD
MNRSARIIGSAHKISAVTRNLNVAARQDFSHVKRKLCGSVQTMSLPSCHFSRPSGFLNLIDSDECRMNPCGPGADCQNTKGSYYCECSINYQPIGKSLQFCPGNKAYCKENNIKSQCNMTNEQQEKLMECTKKTQQDPLCSILQVSLKFLNSSCQTINMQITKEEAKETLNIMAESINNALANKTDSSTFNNAQTSEFLNNIETSALISFAQAPRMQYINTPQLNISMKTAFNICNEKKDLILMTGEDTMKVPCQLVPRKKDGAVLLTYKDLASSINNNFISDESDLEDSEYVEVNSRVVSGAMTASYANEFILPVNFALVQIKPLIRFYKLHCVFWDTKNNGWSDEGCTTVHSNHSHTTCSCNHLSSFAVIMAPIDLEEDNILTIISHVGLSVSLVCLCLSLLTFILCRSLRSAHTSILTALSGCLFLAQLLVLVGLNQTTNKIVCFIIAVGLHFLFLCAFSWMSIESVLLFMTVRNLRAVNYMASRKSHFPFLCLLAFGVPSVIVWITVAVGFKKYHSPKNCWLSSNLVWSFLGPACFFILTNIILLILTVLLLRTRLASLNTEVSTLKNTRLLTFKALAQAFILGCTWIIGYFQFASFSQIISYIFTICNSPQGAYIFIVHCLLNHQVRGEYRKFFRQKKQAADESTLQTISRSVNVSNITMPMTTTISSSTENKAQWE